MLTLKRFVLFFTISIFSVASTGCATSDLRATPFSHTHSNDVFIDGQPASTSPINMNTVVIGAGVVAVAFELFMLSAWAGVWS